MSWLEKILVTISPSLLLTGTAWRGIWDSQHKRAFILGARIYFTIALILYLAHYHFFDVPMQLQPPERWLYYRYGMAGLALAGIVFYSTKAAEVRFYKAPAFLIHTTFCYWQGQVFVWYPESNYLYCFAFAAIGSVVLRGSTSTSVTAAVFFTAIQFPALLNGGLSLPHLLSATTVTALFAAVIRLGHESDIRSFIATQENLATQKKLIELNIEFADRMRAFVPRVIFNRLEQEMQEGGISALQAIDSVLTPRKLEVACLFSDIRGFTEGSKDLDSYINRGVLPNVKACSEAVESNHGIPRKVGDLLFSYFDEDSIGVNLLRCVSAGLDVARLNIDFNESRNDVEIRRYILISVGEAVVGNLGGFDSSIEITALGSPVNFLSRLDDLTKTPGLQEHLNTSDIVICPRSKELLDEMGLSLETLDIDLDQEGLSIRDFPTIRRIFALPPSDNNHDIVRSSLDYIERELELEQHNATSRI
ncbi:MAG: hypothetical protein AAF515_00605 [Pseudomonadota bacterium]